MRDLDTTLRDLVDSSALFSELSSALHGADDNLMSSEKNHKFMAEAERVYEKILDKFGLDAFRPYLSGGDPLMRMQAAMALWETEPDTVIPILVDLHQNSTGIAATNAYMTLFELRRQGKLPNGIRI